MTTRYPNTIPGPYTPTRSESPYRDNTQDLRRSHKRVDAWHEAAVSIGFEYKGSGNYAITISEQHFLVFTGRLFFGRKVKLGNALIADVSFSKQDSPRDIYDRLWKLAYGEAI